MTPFHHIADDLVLREREAGDHERRVRRHRVPLKTRPSAPPDDEDQHQRERDELAEFDADVERDHVEEKPVRRHLQVLKFRRKAKAVDETECEHRASCAGLKSEQRLKATQIVERFVRDRQADNGVNDERIDVDVVENARQQRDLVPDAEKRDVNGDVRQPI